VTDFPEVDIEKELRKSYLEYSLSVIIGRAIPDARDGLKPVHRRILFSQHELGNYHNRPHKKSARIVGDVIGKYHPHGDVAVYDALVRLAQDFSMRDPLVDGQGNFGSIDNDPPAAMRYTEVRMSKLAQEFLADLGKGTVDFRPNYDNTLEEPSVLPTKVPNLLLNGTSGIAVGMATNIPPHNLGELCDGLLLLLDDRETTVDRLMQCVKGPDFPTKGLVYAGKGLAEAYATGRGSVKLRGRLEVEESKKGHVSVVVKEIPYNVNKAALVKKIASLVNDRKLEGITDLRDESDRNGIRIVVDLKRSASPSVVTNHLFKYTQLESSFGINMLAVVENRPQMLNLKSAMTCFLDHRREVVIRRTRFDLARAEARAHILLGLRIAIDNIDAVVALIRASANPDVARTGLMERFSLTEVQAKAILEMRLQRLTGLQREELENEYQELLRCIEFFKSVLADPEVLRGEIRKEIVEIKDTYSTPRRSEIVYDDAESIDVEDLIADDEMVITLSRGGYLKRTSLGNYQQQRRGGKGKTFSIPADDSVQEFLTATNLQYLCIFTNKGLMHQRKTYQIPEVGRQAKGTHINNILPLAEEERVTNVLNLREFSPEEHFLFVTSSGMVKRSAASLYARAAKNGIIAIQLKPGDSLVGVRSVSPDSEVILATAMGMAIRFSVASVRAVGRNSMGVRGISLRNNDRVVGFVTLAPEDQSMELLSISSKGFGKRTKVDLYRFQSRGGVGVLNFRVCERTGHVVGVMPVHDGDGLVFLTSDNMVLRISAASVRITGRVAQGVKLVSLEGDATVVGFDKLEEGEQTESDDRPAGTGDGDDAAPADLPSRDG
jgi:DNA gyrase subunit A